MKIFVFIRLILDVGYGSMVIFAQNCDKESSSLVIGSSIEHNLLVHYDTIVAS